MGTAVRAVDPSSASALAARAGGGASRDTRPRPVGGSAVHPVLTAQLQLVAAESGFLESNPGGYFIVWLRDWRTRES